MIFIKKSFLASLLLLIFLLTSLSFSQPTENASLLNEEKSRINDIDFSFSLIKNEIRIKAFFIIQSSMDCAKHITFDFDHKKNYTRGATAFELEREGEDWYEANYIIEKYFFAKVKALYHYSMDEENNKFDFYLKENKVNMSSFDIVESSVGTIKFKETNNNLAIAYNLVYKLKPTMLKKSLYRIQKNVSIDFLKSYKAYLEENCNA